MYICVYIYNIVCMLACIYVSLCRLSIKCTGPNAWNKIPPEIRNSVSISTFRTNLKTTFYQNLTVNLYIPTAVVN